MSAPLLVPETGEAAQTQGSPARPWQLVVWDDPVNLMTYVARVFRTYFGYPQDLATSLMLAVHTEGHAVVATGPRETMEVHAQAMHDYGLWATVRQSDD
ncbi:MULTISPECIES: ATP-dependent Clp protease adapter ClpS [Bacteria]|uniref:ATP-dependent Clp protease adapter ClpS n=1 Tax=Bacteria TaxID=2 RepID=UPI003C7D6D37